MNACLISVTGLGKTARSLLTDARCGVITGITSRGIFIVLDSNWVLFLSYESFRGPLTLNLSGEFPVSRGLEASQTVSIQDGKIQIHSVRIEVDFNRARTWEAPLRSEIWLPPGERAGSLKTVAGLVLSQKKEPGFYLVLQELLGLQSDLGPPPPSYARVDCSRLLQFLQNGTLAEIVSALTPFLGLGAGLTPAGDDMILGLLLAYRRWEVALRPSFDVSKLSDLLNQTASCKTALLSANLIATAAQGQADQRLITALDGIMTGSPTPDRCALSLSGWGNSSGCDALVGMSLAILSAQS